MIRGVHFCSAASLKILASTGEFVDDFGTGYSKSVLTCQRFPGDTVEDWIAPSCKHIDNQQDRADCHSDQSKWLAACHLHTTQRVSRMSQRVRVLAELGLRLRPGAICSVRPLTALAFQFWFLAEHQVLSVALRSQRAECLPIRRVYHVPSRSKHHASQHDGFHLHGHRRQRTGARCFQGKGGSIAPRLNAEKQANGLHVVEPLSRSSQLLAGHWRAASSACENT